MKALTLHQPWATWIATGRKTLETRMHVRFKCLIGQDVAIHAGQQWDETAVGRAREVGWDPDHLDTDDATLQLGMVLAVVRVNALFRMLCYVKAIRSERKAMTPLEGGTYCYELTNVRPLARPFLAKGRQGIWIVDDGLIAAAGVLEARK